MERYPHLVDVILKGGHEIAAHGYLHENPNKLSPEDELYWLERQIAVIEKMTGKSVYAFIYYVFPTHQFKE